jgi:UDP-N-acetylmuramate dehydrogenase
MQSILNNISLKSYNSFGIDVKAKKFVNISTQKELIEVLQNNKKQDKFILGGGSNMLLTKDINALVIHINNKGIQTIKEKDNFVIVNAKAGENWHEFVIWCLKNNLGGVENLSLIPGNVGTTPVQNIGAYGVELKDIFHSCEAIHIETQKSKIFNLEDCLFGYRDSVFKNDKKNKYIITSVNFKLTKTSHNINTTYGAILAELEKHQIKKPTIKDISNVVIAIRESKLPDPKKIGNSGSFFKNPIITIEQYNKLLLNFPNMPYYKISTNEIKIPAGWLIEKAGFKGKRFGDYGVHKNQALVLVNYGNANGNDIYNLSKLIQKTIKRIFNIELIREVNVI